MMQCLLKLAHIGTDFCCGKGHGHSHDDPLLVPFRDGQQTAAARLRKQ